LIHFYKRINKMPYKTYQPPAAKKTTRGSAAAAAAAVVDPQTALIDVKCDDAEMTDVNEEETATETENGIEKKKPWLQRTKEGGVKKIPKDVQKRRRNYRLKKMLTPKAPIMVLHELLGQSSVNYEPVEPEQPTMRSMPQLFTVKAVYEEQTFTGMGPSKSIAKNVCAEHILQYITTRSCIKKPEIEEDQENGSPNSKNNRNQESDTPWVSLASLALFKLFNDWQSQGYEIPVEMLKGSSERILGQADKTPAGENAGAANPPKPKKATVKAEKVLPENPTEKHPVQLLNEMNGPLVYEQTAQTGAPPNCIFTLTVTVNETPYTGEGKSKKEAKKAAAQAALSALWGVQYTTTQ
jgi:dsRNA-specific ribonuclease